MTALTAEVRAHALSAVAPLTLGQVAELLGLQIRVTGLSAAVGDLVAVEGSSTVLAEVAGFRVAECAGCGGVLKPDVVFFGENVPRDRVARAFALVDGRSESPPESWVRVACALAGLPAPVLQYEVFEGGSWLARVDLAWPDRRLIVEYDGEYHFDGLQIAKDDVRLAALVAAGWHVIRLSAADLRHMDDVVSRIAAALRTYPTVG